MLLMFVAAALVLSSTAVTAAVGDFAGGAFGELATELFGGNILQAYNMFPSVFDAILLLILFVGITTFAFKEKFGEQTKLISWSLSIILALGGTVAFHTIIKTNNTVQDMCQAAAPGTNSCGMAYLIAGPAGLAFLFVIGALLFYLINAITNSKGIAFSIAYIFIYSLTKSFFGKDGGVGFMSFVFKGTINIILLLVWYAMIVYLVYALIQYLVHMWSQGAGRGMSAAGAGMTRLGEGLNRMVDGGRNLGRAYTDTVRSRQLNNINEQLEHQEELHEEEIGREDMDDEQRLNASIAALDRLIQYNRNYEYRPPGAI